MSVDSAKVSKEHCNLWKTTPTVNPLTKRNILISGPTYNKLQTICKNKFNIDAGDIPNITKSSPKKEESKIITSRIKTPRVIEEERVIVEDKQGIRKCTFVKFKAPGIGELTPRRKSIIDGVRPSDAVLLRDLYSRFGICEAPPHVNLNYDTGLSKIRSGLGKGIGELLHMMHGDTIHPGTWRLVHNNSKIMRVFQRASQLKVTYTDKDTDVFKGLVERVRETGEPITTTIDILLSNARVAHAIALVLFRTPRAKTVSIAIIDPNMDHGKPEYAQMLRKFLINRNEFGLTKIVGSIAIADTYQSANSTVKKSSLDPGGYCALWTCLLMEMFAIYVSKGNKIKNISDVEKAITLPVTIPKDGNLLWRKLIIDYTVSRLLAVNMMAHELCKAHCARKDLDDAFMSKYVETVDNQAIKDELVRYVGENKGNAFLTRLNDVKTKHYADKMFTNASQIPLPE